MKYILILLLFFATPGLALACIDQGCDTIEKFVNSYVEAIVDKNQELIRKHYYDDDYTCYIDRFSVKGKYRDFNIQDKSKLESQAWDAFELTYRSEATKIKLFYEHKESYPNKTNKEVMGMVFEELMKADTERVDVPFKVKPEYQLDLSINGRLHRKDHPCFTYTGLGDSMFLVSTGKGFKAVEPMCDVGRAVGRTRVEQDKKNDNAERIFESLSIDQINYYIDMLGDGRIATVSQFSKDLSVETSLAKEVVLNKICFLIP